MSMAFHLAKACHQVLHFKRSIQNKTTDEQHMACGWIITINKVLH